MNTSKENNNNNLATINRLKELNGKRNNQTNKDFCIKLIENICMFNTTLFEITDTYQVEKIDEKEEEKKIIDEYKEILKQEKEIKENCEIRIND